MSKGVFEMTPRLAEKLKDGAKLELLKEYAIYLLDRGIVKSKKECMSKLGPVISHMMDMGDCTNSDLDYVESWLDKRMSGVVARRQASLEEIADRGLREAFVEAPSEEFLKRISNEEAELVKEYSEALAKLHDIENKLAVTSNEWMVDNMKNMVSKYHKLFDENFVSVFK